MASDNENKDIEDENTDFEVIMDSPHFEINISEDVGTEEEPASKESEESWEENKVKMLLNLYLQNINRFQDPKQKNKFIWKEIALDVCRDPVCCEKKVIKLKQHYRDLLINIRRGKKIKWPYFNLMKQIHVKGGVKEIKHKKYKCKPIIPRAQPPILVMTNHPTIQTLPMTGLNTTIQVNGFGPVNSVYMPHQKERSDECSGITIGAELTEWQKSIEQKLDRLVKVVQDSNNLQRANNKLLQECLTRTSK